MTPEVAAVAGITSSFTTADAPGITSSFTTADAPEIWPGITSLLTTVDAPGITSSLTTADAAETTDANFGSALSPSELDELLSPHGNLVPEVSADIRNIMHLLPPGNVAKLRSLKLLKVANVISSEEKYAARKAELIPDYVVSEMMMMKYSCCYLLLLRVL